MTRRGGILLSTLGIIWGSNFLFMKLAVSLIPPLEVAVWRVAFGTLPVVAVALARRQLSQAHMRHWRHFLAMAILANIGPYVLFTVGTAHLPSGIAGAIAGAVPCIAAVIAAIVVPSERPTLAMSAGLLFGLAGVLALSPLNSEGSAEALQWVGVFAMLGGSLSYAVALLYARRFIRPLGLNSTALAAYQMVFALALLLPFSHPASVEALAGNPVAFSGLVMGLGLMGTGVAFVIYYEVVSEMGALRAGTVYYIPPAVALLMGAVFLGEPLGMREMIGTAFILMGIYHASQKREHARRRPDPLRLHQSEDGSPRDGTSL